MNDYLQSREPIKDYLNKIKFTTGLHNKVSPGNKSAADLPCRWLHIHFRVLCTFLSWYLSTIRLPPIFSFREENFQYSGEIEHQTSKCAWHLPQKTPVNDSWLISCLNLLHQTPHGQDTWGFGIELFLLQLPRWKKALLFSFPPLHNKLNSRASRLI